MHTVSNEFGTFINYVRENYFTKNYSNLIENEHRLNYDLN